MKPLSLHCTLKTNLTGPTGNFNVSVQHADINGNREAAYIERHVPLEERPPIRSKQELMEMYPECFKGTVGCFEVQRVVHAPRKAPIELKDRLQVELSKMESQDIIARVTQPTEWVNRRLRFCLDPKDLNKAIKREHHPTATLEEIAPKLTGAKLFSKLDARNGYWNVKLDEES